MTVSRKHASRVANECIGLRSRQLGRLVTRLYDDVLRSHGLTGAQFGLLAAIELLAPVQPVQLGQKLGIEKSALSRNLQRMRDAGWVEVTVSLTGKGHFLQLADMGRELLITAMPAWEQAQEDAKRLIGTDAAVVLDHLLSNRPK